MAGFAYLVVAALAIAALADASDFCQMQSCKKGPHTMCRFPSPKPSSQCASYEVASLTPKEQQEILDAHNAYRALVASGREKHGVHGGQPAGRIGPLKWNKNLEEIAQRWANQCNFAHDLCRNVDAYNVGQNLAIKMHSDGYKATLTELVKMWSDEVSMFDPRGVSKYQFDKRTGHYTQLIWGDTTDLGCGLVKYRMADKSRLWYATYLVCNYGPAGNWQGEPVYKTL